MHYRITHITTFEYSATIRESVMEVRMQPRSDCGQRCLEFDLRLEPEVRPHVYKDFLGNRVHHFDIPSKHDRLELSVHALVDVSPNVSPGANDARRITWDHMDQQRKDGSNWDWLHPSHFAEPTNRLRSLMEEIGATRRDDPLTVLRELNESLSRTIRYERGSTRVDSPIDVCLEQKKGVCQDLTHVFITMARQLGIPARYVSGYLFHRIDGPPSPGEDASHSWAEVLMPDTGWMGFDPSNRMIVGVEHIRVAVGRDYADVPPTRGVYRGLAQSKLSVHVEVERR